MFDEILRELEALGDSHRVGISFQLDDDGFFDRLCPCAECHGAFKVLFEDWRDKVPDEAYCPFCRHRAPSSD